MATLPRGARLREFVVEKVIGVGGFGIVYLAGDPALGRRVAIKEYMPSSVALRADDGLSVISRSVDSTETFVAGLRSFVNEARLLVRFDHPALVKVHQFWESHGTAYMVMPFYEGPTLRHALSNLGRLPTEEEILAWLMPLLDALELLHADNCLHRDIAPDNILLTEHGPLLLDFGAARRVIGDLTHALTAVLKPGFAPVEQYGDSPDLKQGPWTDLFALASVIYLAATGVRPPPSVDRIVVDRMQPLARLAEGMFSEPLLKAVDHALAVLPANRPQSVAEFRAMLQGRIAVPEVGAATLPLSQAAPGRQPNNLPRQRTSFVGREAEVAEVKALLDTAPLVTVLGMGGMGKTRLTLQVATELLPRYADGAWFVDLSSVQDPALVVQAAAQALDLLEEPGRPLVETVCAWLRPRRALLVLDNCEHLIEAAGDFVHAVLERAPQAAVLASSRELLDVPGEQAFPIRPLPLPARDAGRQSVLQAAAVRMFIDRARAQQPDFEAGIEDPAALAELVNRLEGIPLAIELAAARLKTLDVSEIVAGLDDRYALLAGGSRQLQRRQQTLRALVDWSYDMLAPAEQRVFARLAVFAGRFDEAAARAVCADGGDAPEQVPVVLASLVQKSLVVREGDGEAQRLRVLETLRDYAREKLDGLDPSGAAAGRHCAHYFAFAKEAGRGIQGRDQGLWAGRLEEQIDNLRAAAGCALGGGADPLIAVKLAVALTGFWILRGHCAEGRRQVDAALALPAVRQSPMAEAWALYTGAALAGSQGDHEAASAMLERCLALRRALGQPVDIAATLSTLALARLQAGDPEAAEAHEFEALGLFDAIDDRRGQAIGWLHLGQVHAWTGEGDAALADLERAVDLAREIGNREIEAEGELTAAEVHWRAGDAGAAGAAAQRSLEICQAAGDRRGEATAHWWLGRIGLLARRTDGALSLLQHALRDLHQHDMRPQRLGCLEDIVHAWLDLGQAARGVELAAAVDQARQRLKLGRAPVDAPRWASLVAALRSALDADEAEAAARSGRAWETDDAVRAALAVDDGPTRRA